MAMTLAASPATAAMARAQDVAPAGTIDGRVVHSGEGSPAARAASLLRCA